jgi:hypothetical protein
MQPITAERKYLIKKWTALGVIAAIILTAAGYGLFYWYSATHLIVTNTRPSNGTAATATDVVFWYNRPISKDMAKNFSISPKVSGKTTVNGNMLKFEPTSALDYGVTFTATISHGASLDGKYKIGSTKLTFKTGFVPDDQIPKKVRDRALKLTDGEPPSIGYFGADNLTNQGVTSPQLINVEKVLKEIFDSTPVTDYAINIDHVVAAPFDSNSTDPSQTYTFNVEINDVAYKATLSCKVAGDAQLLLYNMAGVLVKDSGIMKSADQVDDSNL